MMNESDKRWVLAPILAAFCVLGATPFGCGFATDGLGTADDASVHGEQSPLDGGSTPLDSESPREDASTPHEVGTDTGSVSLDAGAPLGTSCGADGKGTTLHVAEGIDVCLPPVVCTSETCPPSLGKCVDGACVFSPGYHGLQTLPQAWATYYCTLSTGGCHGVTQIEFPEVTAGEIAKSSGLPLCEGNERVKGSCVGIAASSPMVVGNSQVAIDPSTGKPVSTWGLGLTESSGLCYEVTGPGGTAVVALTDRCGGYCKCKGSAYGECGPCVSAPDMQPNCACVGSVPGISDACCGRGCGTPKADCDWCASNNHPHFDLDTGTFNHVCGAEGSKGSCQITKARFVPCLAPKSGWPPGGSGASCKKGSFFCEGASDHHALVPGTKCCCDWDLAPQPGGTCK